MRRRVPVLLTLLPLALLLGGYWWWWNGRADAFRSELELFAPGVAFRIVGFPYRLEARSGPADKSLRAPDAVLSWQAEAWSVERQPWRSGLSVVGARQPEVYGVSSGPVQASIVARNGSASVTTDQERVSATFEQAFVQLLTVQGAARHFELHIRAIPMPSGPAARATGFQVYLRAEHAVLVRPLQGDRQERINFDPLGIEGAAIIVAKRPLVSLADWMKDGALRVTELKISASKLPELAVIRADVTPAAPGLRVSGTIVTVCPRAFAALLGGPHAPAPEYRTRRPVTLRFSGPLGAERLSEALPGLMLTRTREAPCPRLRG